MSEPTTPAAEPTATPTPAAPASAEPTLVEQAVAAAVAARAAGPTEDEDTVVATPAAEAPPAPVVDTPKDVPTPVPAAPPTPAEDPDEKFARLFARVSGVEAERQKERAEVAQLRAEAARAKEYDDAFGKFREDPEQLFKRVGWSPETISAYIKGEKAPVQQAAAQTAVEAKLAAMEAHINNLTSQIAKEREQQTTTQLRSQLPVLLQGEHAAKFPTSAVFFRKAPHEFADAVMATVSQARTAGKELSYEEAATAVENVIRGHKERFAPEPAVSGGVSAPASTKSVPSTPTLTNATTPAASSTPSDPESEPLDSRLKRAEAQLRLLKRPE